MLTASRILGTEVGSTAPVFLALLAVHVLGGITAVASGAIAAITCKGSPWHVRAGRCYYRAITIVFITAAVLAIMRWRQDWYLLILGAVAFTAATIGYQHRRRHWPGDTGHIAGMGTAYVAMLTAFYVDNGPHLPLWDHLPALGFWLLPSAIGHRSSSARSSALAGQTPRGPAADTLSDGCRYARKLPGGRTLEPGRAGRQQPGRSEASVRKMTGRDELPARMADASAWTGC